MNNFSTKQALHVWSELWQAYYGKNGYGSDTAEIYAYTIRPDRPTRYSTPEIKNIMPQMAVGVDEKMREDYDAARDMIELLQLFQEETDSIIKVDGQPLAGWMAAKQFDHRWHIQVIPRTRH